MNNPNFNKILSEALAKYNHKTNSDRIRSMTDKDMAMFLRSLTECVRCPAWDRDGEYDMRPCYTGKQSCSYMWLSWLEEEVKEE